MTDFETFFSGEWAERLKAVPDQSLSWDRKAAWLYWTDALGRPAGADLLRTTSSYFSDCRCR